MTILAILPAAILFIVVYRSDKIEREPLGLLFRLLLLGGATIISAMVLGLLGEFVVEEFVEPDTMLYLVIDNFILTALVEEGGKYFVLKKSTWRAKSFDYTFDAAVYAVTVSLGFALIENILYLTDGDLGTAIARALLSVPGHAIDAVYMGYYYGIAKRCEMQGDRASMKHNLRLALLVPVLIHGFYDFCLEVNYDIFLLIFLVFEIFITVHTIRKFRKLAREDKIL